MKNAQESAEIEASNTEAVREVEQTGKRLFRDFRDSNEQFHFEYVVTDSDGFEVVGLADFGIEDMEEGAYYVSSVSAIVDEQPTDDLDEIKQSKAFETAEGIMDAAVSVLDRPDPEYLNPDSTDGERFEASYTIVYNLNNLR